MVTIRGQVDDFIAERISGWAWDPAHPDDAIDVEIVDGGNVIARVRADMFRQDLLAAGVGNGCHGFNTVDFGRYFQHSRRHLQVRRAHDGAALGDSPVTLVATGAVHLLASARSPRWSIMFGGSTYEIQTWESAIELAAFLPLTAERPFDDPLPLAGHAHMKRVPQGVALMLRGFDESTHLALPLGRPQQATPYARWCRGGPTADGWVDAIAELEVENLIGVKLRCIVPGHPTAGNKPMQVLSEDDPVREFTLERGNATTIAFRTRMKDRHRIRFITVPEPGGRVRSGFKLTRFDAAFRHRLQLNEVHA